MEKKRAYAYVAAYLQPLLFIFPLLWERRKKKRTRLKRG